MFFCAKTEIAKSLNVLYEPDEQLLESENPKSIYGVDAVTTIPLLDFNSELIGPPPIPPSIPPNHNSTSHIVRPIGFDLPSPPSHQPSSSHTSPINQPDPNAMPKPNPTSRLDKLANELHQATQPKKGPLDRSPPPNYDSVIAGPSAPSALDPPSPPTHQPNAFKGADGDESDIDFDDLAKRFEALKKAK